MNTQQSDYAVIAVDGKQHRVKVGQHVKFEYLTGEPGDAVELGQVLMLAEGGNVQIGAPYLSGKVMGKIVEHGRGKKVIIFKMRRRKGYRRKQGHRQGFTEVEITSIN